jgi:hypothetical protein
LGGYFPKNLDKQYFFIQIFSGIKKREKRKQDLEKTLRLARQGGH